MTSPPSRRNISTACSGWTMSESPMMSMVGAAIARTSSADHWGRSAFIWVTFSISLGQSPGLGATLA